MDDLQYVDSNFDYLAGVELVPQPKPSYSKGGDCFACAMTAVARHLFPERGLKLWEVYEYFLAQYDTGDEFNVYFLNGPGQYNQMFQNAHYKGGLEIDWFPHVVTPDLGRLSSAHDMAWGPGLPLKKWAIFMEGMFRAGWLATASVNYKGSGQWAEGTHGQRVHEHTDHIIVIDGVRTSWARIRPNVNGWSYRVDAHVVDSAAGGRSHWVNLEDLMIKHGLALMWMVRRSEGKTYEGR